MITQTSQELKAREDQREQQWRDVTISHLEKVLEHNLPEIRPGGRIEYGHTDEKEQALISQYLAEKGWRVEFTYQSIPSYHMITISDVGYRRYYLNLTPLPT